MYAIPVSSTEQPNTTTCFFFQFTATNLLFWQLQMLKWNKRRPFYSKNIKLQVPCDLNLLLLIIAVASHSETKQNRNWLEYLREKWDNFLYKSKETMKNYIKACFQSFKLEKFEVNRTKETRSK